MGTGHPWTWIDQNRSEKLSWVIYVFGSKSNRTDQIRVESQVQIYSDQNQSNFLKLFGLTLNMTNIGTPSVGIASVGTS